MDLSGALGSTLRSARVNAAIAWVFLLGVCVVAGRNALAGRLAWAGFASAFVVVALVPPVAFRDVTVMLPWEVLSIAALSLAGRTLLSGGPGQLLAGYVAVAAFALVVAVELHVFTAIRMTDWFAVAFVVVTTLATAGLWAVCQWLFAAVLDTAFVAGLRPLMIQFTGATVAGVGAGVVFSLYFRRAGAADSRYDPPVRPRDPTPVSDRPSPRLRDRFGVSERHEQRFIRALQLVLVGLFGLGLVLGNLGVVVNCGIALVVTQLPAVLERDYELAVDPGLALWVTMAVSVHGLGSLGPYETIWWWDVVAHTLSASVVAAIGYTTVQVLVEHTDDVFVPPRVLRLFVVLFVVAAGVFWEVIEFLVGEFTDLAGTGDVLVQYGLEDTMQDLLFDIVGGLLVALWGTSPLRPTVDDLTRWLDQRRRE